MNKIILTATAAIAATPAFADAGLHHHPHGIPGGWAVVVAVLAATPMVALAVKRFRK